ncbi:AAA family ATPase [Motilimonas eburnea]|uniref:AAA family ATPase n=1 Tax=Motilimonas eburnea TaxID=1737488 RepID=UPI001E4957E6|nr:AAA family ATPase [Motilimonas eburnea]MCE2571702.1 AAA family ATPase [Motilimonas eburnea]
MNAQVTNLNVNPSQVNYNEMEMKPLGEVLKNIDLPDGAKAMQVPVRKHKHEAVPDLNPLYFPNKKIAMMAVNWWFAQANCYKPLHCWGESGAGKSELARWLCACFNEPMFQLTFHGQMRVQSVEGYSILVEEGAGVITRHIESDLMQAYEHGGMFVADELDKANPDVTSHLHDICDGKPHTTEKGKTIVRHKQFRLMSTGNTNGNGSTRYTTCMPWDAALRLRFAFLVHPYPEMENEIAILKAISPIIDLAGRKLMVQVANFIRELASPDIDSVSSPFGVRNTVDWYKYCLVFGEAATLKNALDFTYLNGLEADELEVANDAIAKKFADALEKPLSAYLAKKS